MTGLPRCGSANHCRERGAEQGDELLFVISGKNRIIVILEPFFGFGVAKREQLEFDQQKRPIGIFDHADGELPIGHRFYSAICEAARSVSRVFSSIKARKKSSLLLNCA